VRSAKPSSVSEGRPRGKARLPAGPALPKETEWTACRKTRAPFANPRRQQALPRQRWPTPSQVPRADLTTLPSQQPPAPNRIAHRDRETQNIGEYPVPKLAAANRQPRHAVSPLVGRIREAVSVKLLLSPAAAERSGAAMVGQGKLRSRAHGCGPKARTRQLRSESESGRADRRRHSRAACDAARDSAHARRNENPTGSTADRTGVTCGVVPTALHTLNGPRCKKIGLVLAGA